MNNLEKMHTEDLIKLAVNVNSEIQARLSGTLFVLSSSTLSQTKRPPEEAVRIVLELLRGKTD